MNSNSNNQNICARCGMSNPILSKYCFQCGYTLHTEQHIECTKCSATNLSTARFCKTCGTLLPRVNEAKTCPRCKTVVDKNLSACINCSYRFTDVARSTATDNKIRAATTKEIKERKVKEKKLRKAKKEKPIKQKTIKRSARAESTENLEQAREKVVVEQVASITPVKEKRETSFWRRMGLVISLAVTAVLIYTIVYPVFMQTSFLPYSLSRELYVVRHLGADVPHYFGWDLIVYTLSFFGLPVGFLYGGRFGATSLNISSWALAIAGILIIVTLAFAIFDCIEMFCRIISGKRYKHAKVLNAIMFGLTGLIYLFILGAAMFAKNNSYLGRFCSSIVGGTNGFAFGFSAVIILAYYLFTWLVSIIFGKRKVKLVVRLDPVA